MVVRTKANVDELIKDKGGVATAWRVHLWDDFFTNVSLLIYRVDLTVSKHLIQLRVKSLQASSQYDLEVLLNLVVKSNS